MEPNIVVLSMKDEPHKVWAPEPILIEPNAAWIVHLETNSYLRGDLLFIPSPEIIDKTGCKLLTCLVIATEDIFATLTINPNKGRTVKIN